MGAVPGTTVSYNTAVSGGGIFDDGGLVVFAGTSGVVFNTPDDCVGTPSCPS